MTKQIYLDYAAATPIRGEVLEAMQPYMTTEYGNPSSSHQMGRNAREAIDIARQQVADALKCQVNEVVFTGGGTESIALAIKGVSQAFKDTSKNNIITSQVEHAAVITSCEELSERGFNTNYIPVDKQGIIDLEKLSESTNDRTCLMSIMYANNEIGTIQPIDKISKIAHSKNVLLHTDACQAAGYLDINVNNLDVDLLTLNGSKIYGPKGIGVLYIKDGTPITPLFAGGGQENNLRGGTENVPGIVGLGKALSLAQIESEEEVTRLTKIRDNFINSIVLKDKIKLVGDAKHRLANNINIHFIGHEAQNIVAMLDKHGVYCSMGSACSTTKTEPSHVLMAIGLSYHESFECVRFTLGLNTSEEEISQTVQIIKQILRS